MVDGNGAESTMLKKFEDLVGGALPAGIVIGALVAIAIENRSGGGGGSLSKLVAKVPLAGEVITGKKAA